MEMIFRILDIILTFCARRGWLTDWAISKTHEFVRIDTKKVSKKRRKELIELYKYETH